MSFLPAQYDEEPVWNSDTDEVVSSLDHSSATIVVPAQCTYMIFALSNVGSGGGETYISSDSADTNSGVRLEDSVGGLRYFGMPVKPASTLYLHCPGTEADVNILRFYTKK